MKTSCFFFSILILFSVACRQQKKPNYKLSDDSMARLMLDLQLAEVTLPDLSPEQRDSTRMLFDQRLEEIYHLSKDDIKKEIEKLQSDPEKMKIILDKVKMMADSLK